MTIRLNKGTCSSKTTRASLARTRAEWGAYPVIFRELVFIGLLGVAFIPMSAVTAGFLPVTINCPFTPDLSVEDGKRVLYYELNLTNNSSDSVHINKIDISDRRDGSFITSFEGDALMGRVVSVNSREMPDRNLIGPKSSAVVYLELTITGDKHLPVGLDNVVTLIRRKRKESIIASLPEISITKNILGAPLRGGPWTAVYDPTWKRGHRKVHYTVEGITRIPGRFAIDFIRMNDKGKFAIGNSDSVKNWLGYGADVLAVGDGTVVAVKNDFEESPTLSAHYDSSPENAKGNYISLDLGDHRFAFYEHLKPGSIRVLAGQKVTRGEVLGGLGFTGNTTGPHLHFHVADLNSPLGAEGIAFAFGNFDLVGRYDNLGNFGNEKWISSQPKRAIRNERPGANTVIEFLD